MYVADLASLNDVVEGLHGLLDGRLVVETMTLENVDAGKEDERKVASPALLEQP